MSLEQLFHILSRTPEHRAIAAFHDGSLDQIRMLDHHRDQLAIAELVLSQPELFVNRFTLPQKLSRLQ